MDQINMTERDFSTISPSAKWLLLMKGHTNIPYAREVAELITYPEKFVPDYNKKDLTFWARTVHFEQRYKSIGQLLKGLPVINILELSSGYSLRGLDYTLNNDIHFIDTDLPEMIKVKYDLVNNLLSHGVPLKGKLELLPLNALDDRAFKDVTGHFTRENLIIVNEGLLMYLNTIEKEKLCTTIRDILKERGGYWITADVYIQNMHDKLPLKLDNRTTEFFKVQNIEENKFGSFEKAEAFFHNMGFIIEKEAKIDRNELSAYKYMMQSMTFSQLFRFISTGKMQATWRMKPA